MIKTLTEQWREGTLGDGYYYVVSKWSGKIEINDYYDGCWQDLREEYIKEVIAPVPSYDHFSQLVKKVERLQEQLNEANEVIDNFRTYDFTVNDEVAEEYQVKWGVKAKRLYRHRKRGVK